MNAMRLASNVVVHDLEANVGDIDTSRLRAHGWPEELVQQLKRPNLQSDSELTTEISSDTHESHILPGLARE